MLRAPPPKNPPTPCRAPPNAALPKLLASPSPLPNLLTPAMPRPTPARFFLLKVLTSLLCISLYAWPIFVILWNPNFVPRDWYASCSPTVAPIPFVPVMPNWLADKVPLPNRTEPFGKIPPTICFASLVNNTSLPCFKPKAKPLFTLDICLPIPITPRFERSIGYLAALPIALTTPPFIDDKPSRVCIPYLSLILIRFLKKSGAFLKNPTVALPPNFDVVSAIFVPS